MKRFTIAMALIAILTVSSTVLAGIGPAPADSAIAQYNSYTGGVSVSANSVVNWYVASASSSFTGAPAAGIPAGGGLATDNDNFIGESAFSDFSYTGVDLGAVAASGLPQSDLSVNWNSALGDPLQSAPVEFTPVAIYDTVTGNLNITVFGVVNWFIGSASSSLTGAPASGLPAGGGLVTDNDNFVGESAFSSFAYSNVNLGAVAAAGLPLGDLTVSWNSALGSALQTIPVNYVPEPSTIALAALSLCGVVAVRRRRLS